MSRPRTRTDSASEATESVDVAVGMPAEVDETETAQAETATVEQWRDRNHSPAWAFRAAKTLRRWPEGLVVTQSEFTAALREACEVSLSAPSIRTR